MLDLYPSEKYEFRLGLRRGEAATFFAPSEGADSILAERRRWLKECPERCLAVAPAGEPLVTELAELLARCGPTGMSRGFPENPDAGTVLRHLSEHFEPDLVLLAPSPKGELEVVAGAVCFPSHWRLSDKLGRPMWEVHAPVPGLNVTLGAQIGTVLAKLPPEMAWLRSNWALAATEELNQHPDRLLPRLNAEAKLAATWLRAERQALIRLPRAKGVLFGIRIELERLDSLKARSADEAKLLANALQTMPLAMAEYKGLASARDSLIDQLRA